MEAANIRNPENNHKSKSFEKYCVLHAPNGEKRTDMNVIGNAIEKRISRLLTKVGKAKLILMLFSKRQVAIAWGKGKPNQYMKGMRAKAAPTPAMVRIAVKPNTIRLAIINSAMLFYPYGFLFKRRRFG